MAEDINYSPEQHDGFSGNLTYGWYCEKCLGYHYYHYGQYQCPYEDYDYCPHCGQRMRLRR